MRILLVLMICLLHSCSYVEHYLGLEEDNFIEEVMEDYLESRIGVDFDLTPSSEE